LPATGFEGHLQAATDQGTADPACARTLQAAEPPEDGDTTSPGSESALWGLFCWYGFGRLLAFRGSLISGVREGDVGEIELGSSAIAFALLPASNVITSVALVEDFNAFGCR